MAYTKKTWTTGDIAEAVDMNHIEDGIYANDQAIGTLGETVGDQGEAITELQGDVSDLEDAMDKQPAPAQMDGTFVITQHNGNMELTDLDTALGDSEVIQDKADIDGTYPDMVAGNMLSNTGLTDMVPYNFRASAGGPREYDEIVGGSVAWNQLQAYGDFDDSTKWLTLGSSTISISNHIATASISANYSGIRNGVAFGSLTSGHKYFISADIKASNNERILHGCSTSDSTIAIRKAFDVTTSWSNYAFVGALTSNITAAFYMVFSYDFTSNYTLDVKNVNVIDLTATFGTTIADYIYALEQATAGAGVAWLRNNGFMTKDYYAYNAGSLESVQTSAHVMTGFNQWDEQWELGTVNIVTGEKTDSDSRIRSKNYIPVLPNTKYYFKIPAVAVNASICFYDANKKFISGAYYNINESRITPANCYYIMFAPNTGYGVIYNHDICINLNGSRNGEYEPYKTWSYPLDSSLTLRGIMKLQDGKPYFDGDRYAPDGTVTRRYGLLDLGTLNWERIETAGSRYRFRTSSLAYVKSANNSVAPNIICAKYKTTWFSNIYEGTENLTISVSDTKTIGVIDDSYTDAATFKAAMSGVYLVYELATPTTETATPFTSPQTVDPYGTEAYTDAAYAAGDRDFELPVGHETFYPTDQAKKLDSLPFLIDNAGSHNAIYRGKYLGNTVTAEQYAAISDGSFKDLYIGDYWTINGVNWRIAHCDYWLHYGDTECTTHHVVIVPDTNLLAGNGSTTHWFNATDTTTGAYVGSDWYTGNNNNTGRSQVTTMINNAFGSAHILTHREYLKNATANGYESAGAWYDSTHEFMTEEMVYGTKEFKNIINGTNIPAGYTTDHGQLALFRHDHSKICNRAAWWLRAVVSSAFFAYVNNDGLCHARGASTHWVGVRVAFGIKA